MCFRYLWNYPDNWASVNPDFAQCPHSQSEKLTGGEFNICSHKVPLETIRLPVLRLSRYSAITLSLWCTHPSFSLPPFSSGVLYSFLLCSTIQTTPWSLRCSACHFHWPLLLPISVWGCHGYRATNVCQVSRTATSCDLSVSIWIWRVPHEQPQSAQTTSDRKRQRK